MNNLILEMQLSKHPLATTLLDSHSHNGYELIFVTKGELLIDVDGKIYTITSDSLILISPLQSHKIISISSDYIRSYLVLDSKLLDKLLPPVLLSMLKSSFDKYKIFTFEETTNTLISNHFCSIFGELESNNLLADIYINNEIINLFVLLYRNSDIFANSYNSTVHNMQTYIDSNFDKIAGIDELCTRFNLSHGHLSRLFKKHSGYSPIEYLINVRLHNASLLLTSTKDSVASICAQVGFSDYNNFIRTFKKKFGITPLAFRQLNS